MLRRVAVLMLLVFGLATAALAQEDLPDYDAWNTTAARAELVIDAARASTPAMEVLRAQLVDWRTAFQNTEGLNAARIETLRAQIEALGPAPEDGVAEPAELAAQRADLSERLARAEAPVRRAEAELRRAQGLIGEIDTLIARREARELFRLGPSPLNPANWPGAVSALTGWAGDLAAEMRRQLASPIHRAAFNERLPLVLFYLVLGGVLLARGWHWVGRLIHRSAQTEDHSPVARLTVFGLSVVQHVVPVAGILALIQAVEASGFVGHRGSVVLGAIPAMAAAVMAAFWIGRQAFPARESATMLLDLNPAQRRAGRRAAALTGFMLALSLFLDRIAAAEAFEDAERLVLAFPIVLATGMLLTRLGQTLVLHVQNMAAQRDEALFRDRVFLLLGRAVTVLGVAAPVLAGIGYFTAGASFLFPTALSLALLAFLGVLQRLVVNIYGAVTRRREGLDEALTPTLIGFALTLASGPVFALIWGVRVATLSDFWQRILEGFSVGGVQISPSNFLLFAAVFGAGYTATRLLQGTLRNSVLPKTRLDAGGRNALLAGTGYLGIFLAALIAITAAGIDLSSLAIVAGALSVGIGFGLQTIVSNFVSGIILLVERPIKEGDWIEVNGLMGYVREISVRSTRIETFDRSDVIVPNADLIAGVVTNYTHHNNTGRVIVPVGVGYGTDTRRAEAILRAAAEAHPMVLLNPAPSVLFRGFGADSLDFEIRAILRDVNWVLSVKSDLNHEIARRFAEEGIEIPFAQRDIWLRNPEALHPQAPTGATGPDADPDTDTGETDR